MFSIPCTNRKISRSTGCNQQQVKNFLDRNYENEDPGESYHQGLLLSVCVTIYVTIKETMMKKNVVRMTEGSIVGHLIRFAGPIFLGNLFQQLYNLVDSLIVGNFAGDEALAAVSSSGNLIFLFVGLITGLFNGAGVVIAKYFGAEDRQEVHDAIHTTVALALICGIILTALGIVLSPGILRLMKTPDEVFPNSVLYFRIYFLGGIMICLFNAASGIFQAVGNSKPPVFFLIISSVVNVVLDLLFVGCFGWGVGGAAFATVLSHVVVASLSFYKLVHTQEIYRISFSQVRIHKKLMKEILRMGIPSGIQNSVIGLANTVVQTNINKFGEIAMAGCGCYSKIEGFVFLPITSFAMALTTFVSQNLGAGKKERVRKASYIGVLSAMGLAEAIGVITFLFMPVFLSFFSKNPDVVAVGVTQAKVESLFYFLLACSHAEAAVLRGRGKSVVPMVVMLAVWCVIRVSYITIAVRIVPAIRVIFWAYPLTWFISTIIFTIYLFCTARGRMKAERTGF